jgi:hypothetical protein
VSIQDDGDITLNPAGSGQVSVGAVPVVTTTGTQSLTNKNLTGSGNTFPTSLATLTGSQTLTNKDLTSATNTFPANPQPVAASSGTAVIASTTTFAAGSPVVGVTFTAPPTGKVYVNVSAHMEENLANDFAYMAFEVRTGATIGSGTVVHGAVTQEGVAIGGANGLVRIVAGNRVLVTGLTPGSSYNAQTMHLSTPAGTADLFFRYILVEPVL